MKKIYKTAIATILTSALLVGCGGDDDNTSSGSNVSAAEAAANECMTGKILNSTNVSVINVCNFGINVAFFSTKVVKRGIGPNGRIASLNIGNTSNFGFAACRQPYHVKSSDPGTFYCDPNP